VPKNDSSGTSKKNQAGWKKNMDSNSTKNGTGSAAEGRRCDVCGSKFPTLEALEVHRESSHGRSDKPAPLEQEALTFAPGGTVADFETGPRPGGKMDRETSRPAKGWETPGEEGEPRKGRRNEGVAPIEAPDPVAEASLSELPAERTPAPDAPAKKPRRTPAHPE
jgi:hypothetical protein